jgi:hypothetical protein
LTPPPHGTMARRRSRGSTVPGRHLTRRKNHGQYPLWRCQSGRPDRTGVAEHIEMDRAGDSRVGVDGRVRLTAPLMPPPRGSRTRRRAMFEKLAKFRLLGAARPASGPRRMVPANDNRHGVNRPDRSRYRARPNLACRWTFDQGLTCRWEVAGTRQPNPLLVDEPLPDGLIHTTVFGPSYEGKGASGAGRSIEAGLQARICCTRVTNGRESITGGRVTLAIATHSQLWSEGFQGLEPNWGLETIPSKAFVGGNLRNVLGGGTCANLIRREIAGMLAGGKPVR